MADSKKYDGSQWEHSLRKLTTATEAVENPLYSDGTAITSYTISGNTIQNGTPTPSNPVDVNGVGVRTENLLKNDAISTEFRGVQYTVNADKSITVYGTASPQISYFILMGDGAATNDLSAYTTPIFKAGDTLKFSSGSSIYKLRGRNTNGTYVNVLDGTVTLSKDLGLIYIQVAVGATADETIYPMITLSTETDTDYEPYGYKIPISSGGVTTNIYLGSTQTTRRIKKVEYTGAADESWTIVNESTANAYAQNSGNPTPIQGVDKLICTHYQAGEIYNGNTDTGILVVTDGGVRIRDTNAASMSVSSFKAYLAQQYAAGTPVTVWYVLATAETAAVNEPLMKIGTYADTLSNATTIPTTEGANSITVDTTVQPSEFTATWTGWHNATVKEWDGSQWNE